jgi:hypothetical protein
MGKLNIEEEVLVDEAIPTEPAGPAAGDAGVVTRADPSTLREWMAADAARAVPHIDLGTRWVDHAAPAQHQRVSWVPDTGEVYVTDRTGSYIRVLGVVPTARQLAYVLRGWAEVGAGIRPSLSWVEKRVARWNRRRG